MRKVIIAGSRDFNDYERLCEVCNTLLAVESDIEIVSGTCKGADQLGERYAIEHNLPVKKFPADWNKYKRAAGYRRNTQMAEYGDYLIAFWDGLSKGTQMMINIAKKKGLKVKVVIYR
jgi:hypothetical protein